MAEITAALVKQLRDKTGAGMMECKAALTEANGDRAQIRIVYRGHELVGEVVIRPLLGLGAGER